MADEVCKQTQGRFIPLADFSCCEAKGPCVQVCPDDVFEIRKIEPSDYANQWFLSKFKNRVHRGMVIHDPKFARTDQLDTLAGLDHRPVFRRQL
jgi:hypothetical protein